MKKLLAVVLFFAVSLGANSAAHAQSSTLDFPAALAPTNGNGPDAARLNATDPARAQRRAAMSPEEVKHDQQMQILEARTGSTSLSRNTGPTRQYDTNAGAFTVRKFKAQPGAAEQKRGQTHPAGGANPSGKPLVHHHNQKKHFLFF